MSEQGRPVSAWTRFSHDPRDPACAQLRASDRDRDVVQDVLGAAYAEGRLTAEEFEERTERLATMRTLGELPELIRDLVPVSGFAPVARDLRAEAERRYRHQRQQALYGFLMPTLICWAVWTAVMPGGFPWPIFVTIGTVLPLVRLLSTREDSIEHIERELARRERKRLEYRDRRWRRQLPPPPWS